MTTPIVTIELTADGVQEVSARIRTAGEQVEAAKLMQRIAPALDEFDRAVREQLGDVPLDDADAENVRFKRELGE